MSHIHTDPGQHDATVSAYIVRLDTGTPAVMLHLHKKLKQYLQFGGHIELNENPWQAISHEIAEESGYKMSQLRVLQPQVRQKKLSGSVLHPSPIGVQTHQFGNLDHYHTDITYAFVAEEKPAGSIDEGESSEIKLFTTKQLNELEVGTIPENVRETALFVLEECLSNWEQVSF